MPHLLSETLVWCVTLLLFGMGLIGTLIPMLPGIIIIAAGCVWQGVMGKENLAWWEWTVLALLVAGGMVIDKLSGGMGAKKFGSTAAGIWGAMIGAVAGSLLFSPIVGLLFMPFLGALLAELIFARKDIMDAFRAGSGAALGMLAGLLLEFTCGLLIMLQPAMRKEHFPMERMTPRIMKPAIMATGIGTGASISWQNGGMREPGRSTGRERRRFAEYVGETVFLSATEKLRCSCRRLPQGTVTVSF